MVHAIQILEKTPNGCVEPDLSNLLAVIPRSSHRLCWSILDLEAVGDLGPGRNMLDLERISKSDQGYVLSWWDLKELAGRFSDIINVIIVGCENKRRIPRSRGLGDDYFTPTEIVIEMFDSSQWEIYAKDAEVLDAFRRRFRNVQDSPIKHKGDST